jgi:hypothetical protein
MQNNAKLLCNIFKLGRSCMLKIYFVKINEQAYLMLGVVLPVLTITVYEGQKVYLKEREKLT